MSRCWCSKSFRLLYTKREWDSLPATEDAIKQRNVVHLRKVLSERQKHFIKETREIVVGVDALDKTILHEFRADCRY